MDVIIGEQIDADFLPVSQQVGQFLSDRVGIRKVPGLEPSLLFLHSQQDQPALGIGHRRVGWPEILGQLALTVLPQGQLALQIHRFTQQIDV